MKTDTEFVVLVDEQDRQIGIQNKQEVHSDDTPLHRAFSLFLFNPAHQLLLQQRAGTKKTWPLVWSNSCCGHPMPGESYRNAVIRRTLFELGIQLENVYKVCDYRYCFEKNGVVENEICPVFTGVYNGAVVFNPMEVASVRWMNWDDWIAETMDFPDQYSPWCVEETRIINSLNFRFPPS